jgi:DNA modification methylase
LEVAAVTAAQSAPNQSTNSGVGFAERDLAVSWRPIADLIPYARNARTHSDAQVAQIAGSIREFGWTNPVLVDGRSGIVAGHGRVLAARKLKMDAVPVIELFGLSEAQRRAYILADNRLALNAGWDEALLAAEVADLVALGVDLELSGFDAGEVEALLEQANGTTSFADEAPEVPVTPVSRSGDLWLVGSHRLLCGDATRPEDVARALGGALADMVFTDPPYNVDYRGGGHAAIANDDLGSGFGAFLLAACSAFLPQVKGGVYICMSSSELGTLKAAFESAGGHWSTFIVWAKNAFTLGRSDYQRQYEPILYGWPKGVDRFWCGARDQGDVWRHDRPTKNDLHPTMKPIALVEQAIRNSSKTRDVVLDPFGGSGTTLMAAEATGRKACLVELEPGYCDVIVRRWQEATGGVATLEESGQTFADMAGERGVTLQEAAE